MKKHFTLVAGSLFLLCFNCDKIYAQFYDDQAAALILGQSTFTTNVAATSQNGMNYCNGAAIDKSGNLYVADQVNNRVLIFKNATSKTNGSNADFVLGQTIFTTANSGLTQNEFQGPTDVCVDGSGNLYVTDANNNRILIFKNITSLVNAGSLANGANANFVLGEPDFITSNGATSQNGMSYPYRANVDLSGNLYVADDANSRVLIFKNIAAEVTNGTFTNGANADFVLGAPDFVNIYGNLTQSEMENPSGIVIDNKGNLYVSDIEYARVMIFRNVVDSVNAGTLVNGANADFVLGASNFTTDGGTTGITQNSFGEPDGIGVDIYGNFYVVDIDNSRVIVFRNLESQVTDSTLTNGVNADKVLGQSTFTTSNSGTTINSLTFPTGMALDASGNLYVTDQQNNRVIKFTNEALPVTLISFAANMPDNSDVNLTWSTATEINSDNFELMRSVDGVNFTSIASVAAAGNSSTIRDYNYLDNIATLSFSGTIYYQLKEVDIDGNFKLSSVVSVQPGKSSLAEKLWPNPFSDHIQLSINADAPETITVSLLSIDGKMVYRQQYALAQGENQISILNLSNLPAGVYQLTGFDEGKILINQKVIK